MILLRGRRGRWGTSSWGEKGGLDTDGVEGWGFHPRQDTSMEGLSICTYVCSE